MQEPLWEVQLLFTKCLLNLHALADCKFAHHIYVGCADCSWLWWDKLLHVCISLKLRFKGSTGKVSPSADVWKQPSSVGFCAQINHHNKVQSACKVTLWKMCLSLVRDYSCGRDLCLLWWAIGLCGIDWTAKPWCSHAAWLFSHHDWEFIAFLNVKFSKP